MSMGSWGEGPDKESALGTMERGKRGSSRLFPLPIDPRALSIIAACIFIGIPIESQQSRVQVVLCLERLNILRDWAVLFDVLVLSLVHDSLFVCFFSFLHSG